MSLDMDKIESYVKAADLKYRKKNGEIVISMNDDNDNRIVILIGSDDNDFFRMRTLKHLDDEVANASEVGRQALLAWMLKENYSSRSGAWEYDPDDHDHHFTIEIPLFDAELTEKQFIFCLSVVVATLKKIPEMREVLATGNGIDGI